MPTASGKGSGPQKVCDHCGSIYSTTVNTHPAPVRDSFNCLVCGKLLESWDSVHVPTYTLISRPSDDKPDD